MSNFALIRAFSKVDNITTVENVCFQQFNFLESGRSGLFFALLSPIFGGA